jgi:ABC-type Fe3+/spermidine/putrescine transport system ATPase subunit
MALAGSPARKPPAESEHDRPTMLSVRGITRAYGEFEALRGIDLDVGASEFLTLLGASGSGKTTLLKVTAGLTFPTAGTVSIAGRDVTHVPAEKRGIGFVFQHYALFPHLTVVENVAFGLKLRRKSASEVSARVDEMLRLVDLSALGGRYPSELSGGQQQRVAIARALAPRPKLLLLDEPLGALDRRLRQRLGADLRRIQQETQVTAVYVTHDQEEAFLLSDRIAVIEAGELVQVASPRHVYSYPKDLFVANFVGETCRFTGTVKAQRDGGAEVVVAEQTITASTSSPLAVGASVECVIRPERLKVTPVGSNTDLGVDLVTFGTGHVASTTFLGDRERVRVTVNGIDFDAEVEATSRALFRAGDEVAVQWREGEPQAFPCNR